MKNNQETSEVIKKDLSFLRMDDENLEELTVEKVKNAYRKAAREIHPDKADPTNLKQVEEFTAAFQELGNSYQRLLKYIIENMINQNEET